MAVDVAAIHQFFATYGWRYDFDEPTVTWHTGFRGDNANFNIFVHLTGNWLYFTICPLVNAPGDPECERKLHQHLLRLNNSINMAKFGIDNDGDVVLTVELPTENLDYSEFADGLNAISYYSDAHYLEILNVARDPEYKPTTAEAAARTDPGVDKERDEGEGGEKDGDGGGEGWSVN
jgi:hypothetical protein